MDFVNQAIDFNIDELEIDNEQTSQKFDEASSLEAKPNKPSRS